MIHSGEKPFWCRECGFSAIYKSSLIRLSRFWNKKFLFRPLAATGTIFRLVAGSIDWNNLNAEKSYNPVKNYSLSKLANVLFTTELARRLQGTGVTVYAVHPGVVNTELSRHASSSFFPGASWAYQNLTGFLQKDAEQGAATTLYCALDSKTATETGLYYADCKAKPCHRQGSDPEKAKKLWDVSLDMVHLRDHDPFTPNNFI